ncbi:hypothetical protein CPC08DRAFT_804007 [Agrocybe pediades]|nr:hypothetical protein CPC08DRAFT_804007 [Agrocybe pediades]
MKFLVLSFLFSLSGMAAAASRYCHPDHWAHIRDTITITVDLTCALQAGIDAKSIDYNIVVPPSQIVPLGSHVVAPGALSDSLTTAIPNANFVSGQTYDLFFDNNFGVGSKGGQLIAITFALTRDTVERTWPLQSGFNV